MKELPAILDEHGVDYDAGRLSRLLQIYDVDRQGELEYRIERSWCSSNDKKESHGMTEISMSAWEDMEQARAPDF